MFQAHFTRQAEKSFRKIPRDYQKKIKKAILQLEQNPYTVGTIKLINYPVAQYRKRIGDFRILFHIDEEEKMVIIADIKRRTSTTYQ